MELGTVPNFTPNYTPNYTIVFVFKIDLVQIRAFITLTKTLKSNLVSNMFPKDADSFKHDIHNKLSTGYYSIFQIITKNQ